MMYLLMQTIFCSGFQVLFVYPPEKQLPLKYKDLLSFCFPAGVEVGWSEMLIYLLVLSMFNLQIYFFYPPPGYSVSYVFYLETCRFIGLEICLTCIGWVRKGWRQLTIVFLAAVMLVLTKIEVRSIILFLRFLAKYLWSI